MILASMILSSLWVASPLAGAVTVSLDESFRQETLTTSYSDGASSGSESKSASRGSWKLAMELPCSAEQLKSLASDGTITIQVGKSSLEVVVPSTAGLSQNKPSVSFNLLRELQGPAQFVYLTRPSDPPAGSGPAKGTKIAIAGCQLSWSKDRLKVALSSKGNSAPPMGATSYTNATKGKFEGSIPVEVKLVGVTHTLDLPVAGNVNRQERGNESAYGSVVEVSLKGKS